MKPETPSEACEKHCFCQATDWGQDVKGPYIVCCRCGGWTVRWPPEPHRVEETS